MLVVIVENQLVVNFVCEDDQIVAAGEFSQLPEHALRADRSGRIIRIDQDDRARTRTDLPLDVDEIGLPFVVLIEVVGGDWDAKLREHRGIERVVGTGRQYVFPRIDQRSQAEIHRLAYTCCDKHVLN